MRSRFYHVKLNVSDVKFYKELLAYLGFRILQEYDQGFGASDGQASLWVFKNSEARQKSFDYRNTGLNHLAFRVDSKADVDRFYKDYLLAKKIPILFEPAEHPHYNQGKGYYAVFFEDPDHIKLEVAFVA